MPLAPEVIARTGVGPDAEAHYRCRACGWTWSHRVGRPTACPMPRLHQKRRRDPSTRQRFELSRYPVDREKVRVYLEACAAKGYAVPAASELAVDVTKYLDELKARALVGELEHAWAVAGGPSAARESGEDEP